MTPLPKQKDFDPYEECLDAQCAWKNFGGLSIEEAYAKFCENPSYYQEDFMLMDWKGFVYYLSVIERFLKEAEPEDEYDDCEAWILGCAVESQVEEHKKKIAEDMDNRLKSLCDSVLARFERMSIGEKDKKRILKQWPKTRKEPERKRRWQRR